MNIEKKKFVTLFMISAFLISTIHPISFLLVMGLLIYLLLVKLENLKQSKAELELILFTIFLIIWIQFLIFKDAFLTHGLSIIWQNLPQEALSLYFGQVNIITALLSIGLLPMIGGIYATYKYLFREKNKNIYLLISFALAITPLLWLKLIQLTTGLAFLGVVFVLLFAKYSELFMNYFKKTRVSYLIPAFIIFIILFFISSIIPSYYFTQQAIEGAPSDAEIEALQWLNKNSETNATILATLYQGHLVTAVAERKNIPTISNYANVEVGITTGANDYFTVPLIVVEAYDLKEFAKPMVGRSVQVNSVIFTKEDWNLNRLTKAKAHLLVFPPKENINGQKGASSYIKLGESMGINKGYKTSIRDDWFVIPSIKLSDRKSTRLNSSHTDISRMPSSA